LSDEESQSVELKSLKNDLEQLLKLTEDSLLEIKKKNLLESLNIFEESENSKSHNENETKQTVTDDKKLNNLEDVVGRVIKILKNSNETRSFEFIGKYILILIISKPVKGEYSMNAKVQI
jgi:hypothetical protein